MSKENPPHSFTEEEEKRRKAKAFIQKAAGRSLGASPITKSDDKAHHEESRKSSIEENKKEATTHAEKINPEKAAKDPKIQAVIEEKKKAKSHSLQERIGKGGQKEVISEKPKEEKQPVKEDNDKASVPKEELSPAKSKSGGRISKLVQKIKTEVKSKIQKTTPTKKPPTKSK